MQARAARAMMPRLLALSWLVQGHALKRQLPRNGQDFLRLSFHNQSTKARTQTWATLTLEEQLNILQGSHYDIITPERGYYVGYTPALFRLGLPALKMQDGSSGFRVTEPGTEGTTTTFPCLLGLAATWDEDLVGKVSEAMGAEFRGKGANVMIGPSVTVQRLAANGRSFESLSGDDPYLGSRLTKVFVKGIQSQGVMCAIKHIGFTDQETNRKTYNALVDQRTAWELYYPPLEAAVNAGVGAVMCGYNKVNDTYACHSPDLLKRDLRAKMGFQGMVISQWGGVRGIDALENGVDIEMPGRTSKGPGRFNLEQLVTVDPNVIQQATINVRKAIYSIGLDKDIQTQCNPPYCKGHLLSDQRSSEHVTLARDAAMQSVVLLKNEDNMLPLDLKKIRKLALVGTAAQLIGAGLVANADYFSGGGSSHSYWKPGTFGARTAEGVLSERLKWMDEVELVTIQGVMSNLEVLAKLNTIKDCDVIVVVGATTAAEAVDRWSLALDDFADDLIRSVAEFNKPTVVLMQTPGAVTTPWRNMPHVKAIANLFLAGEGTGRAWAGLLLGDYSPSGKLPVMFPASEMDVIAPSFDLTVNYTEGLFTSYRNSKFKAAFPFGHGLSYTNFTISTPRLTSNCTGVACIKFNVTNTGGWRTGSEVPQAYIEFAPELGEPKLILKGFKKVHLHPGQKKEIIFSFTERDISVYHKDQGWIPQRVVRVHVGSSSAKLGDPVILRIKRDSSLSPANASAPTPRLRLRTEEAVAAATPLPQQRQAQSVPPVQSAPQPQ
eukprot:CAMPEP_0171170874 /NCGR_PEP_ID=MMETSP0790-20130122/8931_1 /TAXON_ID=2925 /ORGANISM="Alexandrium catenella, Strain OF101" /LENGTH=776 /DNA_ID=CAMNT_0011635719 /DNA_START=35 /DNA_END=2362 /DNA_ORIENTATION=-